MDLQAIIFVNILFLIPWPSCWCREETENTCVAQIIDPDTLNLLTHASEIISESDLQNALKEVQDHLTKTKTSIGKLDAFHKEQKLGSKIDEISKVQKNYSETLNLIFNTILSNSHVLENLVTANKCKPEKDNVTNSDILNSANENQVMVEIILKEVQQLSKQKNEEIQALKTENEKLKEEIKDAKSYSRPSDCNDIYLSGYKSSGVYEIYPNSCSCSSSVRVWCDMETEGGGWTVILKRQQTRKQENFTRNWEDYQEGFGHPESEYWLGNSYLHELTSNKRFSLRIEATNRSNKRKWGLWETFMVDSLENNYILQVQGFSPLSSLGDVMKSHNKQEFSTVDKDNDSSYDKNCAELSKGGWWYGRCYDIHPTGIMNASDIRMGLSTSKFYYIRKSSLVALQDLELKIKPQMCVTEISNFPKSCN